MTLSIPIDATLYEYTEDSSNPGPMKYEYSNAISYEKDDIVSIGSKLYRCLQDISNRYLTNLHLFLEQDDGDLINFIEYKTGIKVNHLYADRLYIDPYTSPEEAVQYKYDYGFVLMDYPMVEDVNEIYHHNSTGDFDTPTGNHNYVKFVLNAGTVDCEHYINGSSPSSPGTLDHTDTKTFSEFADAYPGYIFITDDSPFQYVSTIGGVWDDSHTAIRADIIDVKFTCDDMSNDTRIEAIPLYPQVAVLDNKNYTYKAAKVKSTYILQAEDKFDTVAITGLIADTVTLSFYDAAMTQIGTTSTHTIDNKRDTRGELPDYPTTVVLYSTSDTGLTTVIPSGGYVKVEVEAAKLQVGGILLGLAVDLGLTDFVFTTKFIDFSPVEEVFHVIQYKEGLKVREYTGSFQFWTTQFDRHDRLLLSLGGKRIIVNGSDTTDNTVPNSLNRFTSTMMVGRLQSLPISTIKVDDRLGELAQAKFTIREQV